MEKEKLKIYSLPAIIFVAILLLIALIVFQSFNSSKAVKSNSVIDAGEVGLAHDENYFPQTGFIEDCVVGVVDGCGEPYIVIPPKESGLTGYSINFPEGFRMIENPFSAWSEIWQSQSPLGVPSDQDDSGAGDEQPSSFIYVTVFNLKGENAIDCGSISKCVYEFASGVSDVEILFINDTVALIEGDYDLGGFTYDLLTEKGDYLYYVGASVAKKDLIEYESAVIESVKSFKLVE